MVIDERVIEELKAAAAQLRRGGEIPSEEKINQYREHFLSRFGPDVLAGLDGEVLLHTMHGRSVENGSLAYWLEFKNDDEFPAIFGSIAGGSALKFGIFLRKETDEWTTGSSTKQIVLSEGEAIDYVRRQRNQLLKCVDLLRSLSPDADEAEYVKLQHDIDEVAPDIANLAWAHKYLCLLFPDKLDDIHSVEHQRFHIIRLLQLPGDIAGKYVCAWWFVELMRQTGLAMLCLTTAIYRRNGHPYRYWRVGTSDGTARRNRWNLMRDGNCVAIGWEKLGDLSEIANEQNAVPQLKELLENNYSTTASQIGKKARQVWSFLKRISEQDVVVAMDGATVLGIAKVTGDYYHEEGQPFSHRRPVQWQSLEEWRMADPGGLQTSVAPLGKNPSNLLEIERHILGAPTLDNRPKKSATVIGRHAIPKLTGIPGHIQSVLDRKSQVILYGPPGTGKTFWAERTAHDLAAYDTHGKPFDELSEPQRFEIVGNPHGQVGRVRFCCFHPAYGYEDFLEGYRPEAENGQMTFVLRPGMFRRLCEDAASNKDRRFYLIIDEINRGDIPRIFGELLTVLERDKRGKPILLPLTGTPLIVPPNIYVIGTMNTADRSIALLDTALRRRFGFIELMPDTSLLAGTVLDGIPLSDWLSSLNSRICQHVGRDARNLQIGHSYLLDSERPISTFARFARIVEDDILPLLEEYCYEDYEVLERILGKYFVDLEHQKIVRELFHPDRKDKLVEALLAPCPEISASADAVEAEAPEDEEDDESDDEQPDEGPES